MFINGKYVPALKILVIGEPRVGITTLMNKVSEGTFRKDYILSIGANFAIKTLKIEDTTIKLQCWILTSSRRFDDVRVLFYKGAQGVIYVYDVTRRETLDNLKQRVKELKYYCGDVPSVIIGNKIDLTREVKKEEGEQCSKSVNALYFETSAIAGTNVEEPFKAIGELLYLGTSATAETSVQEVVKTIEDFKIKEIDLLKERFNVISKFVLSFLTKRGKRIISIYKLPLEEVELDPPPDTAEILRCFEKFTPEGLLLDGYRLIDVEWLEAEIMKAEGDISKLKFIDVSKNLLEQIVEQLREAKRRSAFIKMREDVINILRDRGFVEVEDISRCELWGVPLIWEEAIFNCFEEFVSSGSGIILEGKLFSLDFYREKLKEISKAYNRIEVIDLSEKLGLKRRLVLDLVEEMIIRKLLPTKIEGNEIVFLKDIEASTQLGTGIILSPSDIEEINSKLILYGHEIDPKTLKIVPMKKRRERAKKIVTHIRDCNFLWSKIVGTDISLLPEDITIVTRLYEECVDEDDFKLKLGDLCHLFDGIDKKYLRSIVKNTKSEWGSIILIDEWLKQQNVQTHSEITQPWRKIKRLRNNIGTFHKRSHEVFELCRYFGQSFPPKYPELWETILNKLLESMEKFQGALREISERSIDQ